MLPGRRRAFVAGAVIGAAAAKPRCGTVYCTPAVYTTYPTYPATYGNTGQKTEIIINQPDPKQQQPVAPPPPTYDNNYKGYPPDGAPAYPPQSYPPYPPPSSQPAAAPYQPQQPPAYTPAPQPPAVQPGSPPAVQPGYGVPPPPVENVTRRYFYLVNDANGDVLEINHGSTADGAHVTHDKRKSTRVAHQLWYLDADGILHSMLNDFVLEPKDSGYGSKIIMRRYTGNARQQWTCRDGRISNKLLPSDCISLKKVLLRLDDEAIVSKYEGKSHQNWRVIYVEN